VKNGEIQDWELEKARNAARRSLVSSLQNSLQRAILLSRYAVFYNDPGVINTRYDRVASVTKQDVQRVARQYLTSENRTVIITTPPNKGAAGVPTAPGGGK
jgi:predicted Zn-dependent peptidase